ncbi:hypothetical protein BKA64DRAFT_769493 [Cadophora sp. MPI-SDFR-AT-0126]|nr:hypothetical protein BKA64DRAFT_769493 [Leotiomycetes sp. MPI-SDFR-AT-0126]
MSPDIVMSDFGDSGSLENYLVEANQQDLHVLGQVRQLHSEFLELGNHLSKEFSDLRRSFEREVQEIKMGIRLSTPTRERSRSRGRRAQDNPERFHHRAGESNSEMWELQGNLEAALKAHDLEKSERLRESREYLVNYSEWEKEKREMGEQLENMRARISRLETLGQDKEKQKQLTMEQLEKVVGAKQSLKDQLAELGDENKMLQEQASMLRGLLTKNGGHQVDQMNDTSIVRSFASIREQVQRVAYKLCPTEPINPRYYRDLAPGTKRDFFGLWRPEKEFRNGRFSNGDVDLERGLNKFETALMQLKPGHDVEVAEWRVCTIKCASLLSLQSSRPLKVADRYHPEVDGATVAASKTRGRRAGPGRQAICIA